MMCNQIRLQVSFPTLTRLSLTHALHLVNIVLLRIHTAVTTTMYCNQNRFFILYVVSLENETGDTCQVVWFACYTLVSRYRSLVVSSIFITFLLLCSCWIRFDHDCDMKWHHKNNEPSHALHLGFKQQQGGDLLSKRTPIIEMMFVLLNFAAWLVLCTFILELFIMQFLLLLWWTRSTPIALNVVFLDIFVELVKVIWKVWID